MSCADSSMRARIGLATVSPVDDGEIARHLAGCAACRDERADIVRVVAVLSLLDPEDRGVQSGELFRAPGTPPSVPSAPRPATGAPAPATSASRPSTSAPRPAAVTVPPSPVVAVPGPPQFTPFDPPRLTPPGPPRFTLPVPPVVAPPDPALFTVPGLPAASIVEPPPVAATPGDLREPVLLPAAVTAYRGEGFLPPRPTTGPLARGPHSHRRPRRSPPTVLISCVILAAALGGGAALYPWSASGTPGRVVAAASTSASEGVSIDAVLRQGDGRLALQMTVGGTDSGTSYQVYAGTVDEDLRLLGEFVADGASARWSGDVALPVGELSYVSLREKRGQVVAAATVVPETAPPAV